MEQSKKKKNTQEALQSNSQSDPMSEKYMEDYLRWYEQRKKKKG
jgi:hypothetical protein